MYHFQVTVLTQIQIKSLLQTRTMEHIISMVEILLKLFYYYSINIDRSHLKYSCLRDLHLDC